MWKKGETLMKFLSLDVGTTCCKYQIFDENGNILDYKSQEYSLKKVENKLYVDIETIKDILLFMLKEATKRAKFNSVAISTLGESFVLLDKDDNILYLPMIYTDARGEEDAEWLTNKFGKEKLFERMGVLPQSMYSISKLLYIKRRHPDLFEKADKVMLMCDYLGYILTGERVIDYSLASRTGVFNINQLAFDEEILNEVGISSKLFSKPMRAGSIVGDLKQELLNELGLKDCKLVLGSHDQVCATLGAGVIESGQAADGMGTVECITVLFDKKPSDLNMGLQGYPVVPFAIDGLYCTYILNLSNGSIVNWFKNCLLHKYTGEENNFFEYIEKGMSEKPTGILTLPYFGGAATPYQDINAKGAFIGVNLQTADSDLYKSILEGTAYEMRLNAEVVKEYGINLKSEVATGGGANSDKWLQIKVDVQNIPIKTLRSSEGGLCGVAILQAMAMGVAKNIKDATNIFVKYKSEFVPDKKVNELYEKQFEKYKKLYLTIKEFTK